MKRYAVLMVLLALWLAPGHAAAEDTGWVDRRSGWYVCAFVGQLTDSEFLEVLRFQVDFLSSYMGGLAVGKEIWRYRDYLDVELEAQVAAYFNDYVFECDTGDCIAANPDDPASARQDHTEFNALLAVRWRWFPWDAYVDTSLAVGEGLSYATSVPAVERDLHGEVVDLDHRTSKLLNYLMVEAAFALPSRPCWELIFRIHHRSGIFGIFNDVHGGSNSVALGLRYKL